MTDRGRGHLNITKQWAPPYELPIARPKYG